MIRKLALKYINRDFLKLDKIIIKPEFLNTKPNRCKMNEKRKYFFQYGELKDTVIVNQDNYLVDGYTSYLIAKEQGITGMPVMRIEE